MGRAELAKGAGSFLLFIGFLACLAVAGKQAYGIRLYAIRTYGRVIHEFDPWFNFRATKYLADNGWRKFFTWFDYESWYPLGSPPLSPSTPLAVYPAGCLPLEPSTPLAVCPSSRLPR